jgi:hypothetical protein
VGGILGLLCTHVLCESNILLTCFTCKITFRKNAENLSRNFFGCITVFLKVRLMKIQYL